MCLSDAKGHVRLRRPAGTPVHRLLGPWAARSSPRRAEAINLKGKQFRFVLIKLKAKSRHSEMRVCGRKA